MGDDEDGEHEDKEHEDEEHEEECEETNYLLEAGEVFAGHGHDTHEGKEYVKLRKPYHQNVFDRVVSVKEKEDEEEREKEREEHEESAKSSLLQLLADPEPERRQAKDEQYYTR